MRLGIVSPCYNEQEVLEHSTVRLLGLMDEWIAKGKIDSSSFILYVNDGSTDSTWNIIEKLHRENSRVNGINLAHNVGHQNAIMAGMMCAKDICDGLVTIDCDLQDDVTAIERMVDLYAEGYDVVYGVKVSREGDSFMKRFTAESFYKFQSSLGVNSVYNHADFRFMSRRAVEALAQFPERNLYLRGMIPMIGFRSTTVDDVISERVAGKSKYTIKKMFRLASDGITSFSSRPMVMLFSVGVLMMIVALAMVVYVAVSLILGKFVAGWSSIMLSMWFIGAVITMGLGIVGIYIGKIYTEVKQRPLYIVADKLIH